MEKTNYNMEINQRVESGKFIIHIDILAIGEMKWPGEQIINKKVICHGRNNDTHNRNGAALFSKIIADI